jgi:uncharacterized protein YqeY
MISLSQIDQDLTAAMKAKDQTAVDTLRGLKTRIRNEQIAKTSKELSQEDLVALVKSELKRRKEAAQAFGNGGRKELQEKELAEAVILEKYLPLQLNEQQLSDMADKVIAEDNFTAKDFGQAMSKFKSLAGTQADGAAMAKVLKEKLKA